MIPISKPNREEANVFHGLSWYGIYVIGHSMVWMMLDSRIIVSKPVLVRVCQDGFEVYRSDIFWQSKTVCWCSQTFGSFCAVEITDNLCQSQDLGLSRYLLTWLSRSPSPLLSVSLRLAQ